MRQITLVVALLAWASMVAAASLRLPEGIEFPQNEGSPGTVTFYHETHVDPEKPNCTACHPAQFRILKATARGRLGHERFDKREACGKCHDGKAAFALDEDCARCHAM